MSIRSRLALAIAALLVTTFVIFGFLLIRSVRATLIDQVDDQVAQFASRSKGGGPDSPSKDEDKKGNAEFTGGGTALFEEESPGLGGPPPTESGSRSGSGSYDYERPIAHFVYSEEGKLIVNEPCGYLDEPRSPPIVPEIPSDELNEVVGQVVTVEAEDNSLRYRMLVTRQDSGNIVVTAAPLDDVESAVDRVRTILLWFGAVTLLGASGISWWIIRRELKPVDLMVETATGIAAGDLTMRIPEADDATELGKLSAALNDMLGKIEESVGARIASEARLRRFVSDASHELRNPLTSVRGYAELYRQGAITSPEAVDNAMGRIESEGGRMARLVDDLLMLARLDEDQGLQMAQVDLAAIAREAVADFGVISGNEHPVTFSASGNATLTGDGVRLRQVIDNLLSNVRVHPPADTPVHVSVDQRDGDVILSVADEGPGLSAEQQEHVFDRFWRADPARTRSKGGSGLGLAIVSSIVEGHHGRVELESSPGTGTTFRIILPRLQQS
ncbi:MAG: HAMP domain-containing histidine kinase [Thermomicrobiales bacterium]|nr:HAMP domain-containing histidine kinase [Thermomicrobiales bacterium]